jgi:hypothetical protein
MDGEGVLGTPFKGCPLTFSVGCPEAHGELSFYAGVFRLSLPKAGPDKKAWMAQLQSGLWNLGN